jgi:hypothetical protein
VPVSSQVWRDPAATAPEFTQHEFAIGVKWLELLKELAPRVKRVAVIYRAETPGSEVIE